MLDQYYSFIHHSSFIIISFNGKHPDVLIREGKKRIAIELTRYIMNKEEQQDVQYREEINKYLGHVLLNNIYQKVCKMKNEVVTIRYKNKKSMLDEILNSTSVIDEIEIDGNYWLQKGSDCIITDNLKLDKMSLVDFFKYFDSLIKQGRAIQVYLKKNNKSKVSLEIHFRYNKTFYQKEKIDIEKFYIEKFYIGPHNEDIIINNIVNSIKLKIDKYQLSVSDMKNNNTNYDEYKLLVYGLRIPSTVDSDKLYNSVLKAVDITKFDEIIILLFGEIMIIDRNSYKVVRVK
jgi:hypothetical protein